MTELPAKAFSSPAWHCLSGDCSVLTYTIQAETCDTTCPHCRIAGRAIPATPLRKVANDRQEGGDHYQNSGIQPWDYIAANALDWFQGEIIKYVTRWREKGKMGDLKKAAHVLQKYIETEEIK